MAEQPDATTVHRLIEAQAARSPDAVAVLAAGRGLTYRRLNARANRLAHHLRRLGVGPEVLVGLYTHRGADTVVGLLAVLKAGGAYVPLDPAFPRQRLAYMVGDARAAVLLTERRLAGSLPEHAARVVCIDGDWDAPGLSEDNPAGGAAGDNLVYVLYTSGSTGNPKGVEVTHRALVNLLLSMKERPGLGPEDALLAITTLSFDIAALEIYLPLVVGARVVVLGQEVVSDGPRLLAEMLAPEVTVMQATPATWRLLLSAGWQPGKPLKVLCGGEALPRDLANRLLDRAACVWNVYGPTETTVWSALHRLEGRDGPVPIGGPIANTQLYLLDADLRPVPRGEVGELWIGGAGLARGYRNRPALTAQAFLPDPFSGEPGARLYRTGDLARQLPDGAVECLGRVDHQVKIRGFRIELGDVEAALAKHPGVREAVVVARADDGGDKRLVAYITPARPPTPRPTELRRYLLQKLPAYMVPSAVVALDRLPLTPNGKVDRRALPEPGWRRDDEDFAPPRDELERRLAGVWEEVLEIRPIGIRDNLFELGVHSLTGARLLAEAEKVLGRRLPPGTLFQAPTVEQFAELVRQRPGPPRFSSLVGIQPRGTRPPLFCVHGGVGTVLLFQELAARLGDDQPLYGLQMQGLYGGAAPHATVEEMAAHYLHEMRAAQPAGPYLLGGYCFGGIVAFEMARRLRALGQEVALLVLFNAPSPPYIRRHKGQVMRTAVVARPESPPPLAAQKASLFRKGWSLLRTLYRDVRRRYRRTLLNARCVLHSRLRLPVPEALRGHFFVRVNHGAEARYRPQAYPGPMVLFRAADVYHEHDLGWGEFVKAGIEIHEIPGTHVNQRTIMSEPCVGLVAERLAEILSRAAPAEVTP
jgi:amino acid adenylation domain-containing protein